jgi:hypothetical protein
MRDTSYCIGTILFAINFIYNQKELETSGMLHFTCCTLTVQDKIFHWRSYQTLCVKQLSLLVPIQEEVIASNQLSWVRFDVVFLSASKQMWQYFTPFHQPCYHSRLYSLTHKMNRMKSTMMAKELDSNFCGQEMRNSFHTMMHLSACTTKVYYYNNTLLRMHILLTLDTWECPDC